MKLRMGVSFCLALAVLLAIPRLGISQVPNPDYDAVAGKLDKGGTLYVYADVEGLVQDFIAKLEPVLMQTGHPAAAVFPTIARAVTQSLGLDQLDDIGISVLPLSEKQGRMKAYLRLKERVGLFGLLGGEPKNLEGLSFVPADAVLASDQCLDPGQVIPLAKQVANGVMGAAGTAQIDAALERVKSQLGLDLSAILMSLDGEAALYVRLDAAKQIEIPHGPNPLKMPRPTFVLMAKVKDATLANAVTAQLKKFSRFPVAEQKAADGTAMTVVEIEQNPFGCKPTFAQSQNWFIFASDPKELDDALEARKSGKDIRSAPEYQALAAGMPQSLSGAQFQSQRAAQEMAALLQRVGELAAGGGARAAMPMSLLGMARAAEGPGRLGVRVNAPDGVEWIVQGNVGASDAVTATAAVPIAAVLAAIAVPNFMEAQTRSKVARSKADMRSLATAIESYNVDYNSYPPSSAEPSQSVLGAGPDGKGVSSLTARNVLSTPIAYITGLPKDPFAKTPGNTFGYYAPAGPDGKTTGWILFGAGPDSRIDVKWDEFKPQDKGWDRERFRALYSFDPTNGTISPGDVMRDNQGTY